MDDASLRLIEKIAGILLAVAAILSPIVTLVLGRMEQRNRQREAEQKARLDEQRGDADDLLDFSNAAKIQGDTWQSIVVNLRSEVDWLKSREHDLLAKLQVVEDELQRNKAKLDSVMESEMSRSKELEQKVIFVTAENDDLRSKIVMVEADNLRLQTELNDTRTEVQTVRTENIQLREYIDALESRLKASLSAVQEDVKTIIKKQTGELRNGPERSHGAA